MGNTIGKIFKLTTFGESHGDAIGGIIDGCPAGLIIDLDFIQQQLDRRKPGQSKLTTQRKESDTVQFLSGIFEGVTTGTPIGFIIKNKDAKSKDYSHLKDIYRPSHADFTYDKKYGIRDYRGGGRSSARETANWVVAGAIAQQILATAGVEVRAYVSAVGNVKLNKCHKDLDLSLTDTNLVRCPDVVIAQQMILEIEKTKKEGDTIGGEITAIAFGVPVGWGEPVFDKLHADIGKGMLSINAVHGFKYGFGGVDISSSKGSVVNDEFLPTPNPSMEGNVGGSLQYEDSIRRKIIPYNPKLKEFASQLRKNMTFSEVLLWDEIKQNKLGVDFDRQRPMDEFIVDFYCKDLMLAIEIDGSSHDYKYLEDLDRQDTLEKIGVTFIRFDDKDVKQDMNNVLNALIQKIEELKQKGLVGREQISDSPLLGGEKGVGSDNSPLGMGVKSVEEFPSQEESKRWVPTKTNFSGGIQGGISNGNDIYCEVAFKPVATIMQKQNTIDAAGKKVEIKGKGRHDACVVPRAVPIVESMMALTLVDAYLRSRTDRLI
ncbi:MAG: chorismate synthase [Flavobacteriales bacterium]|nr:chorismate synthase [Flavobacteriales bacterium]